MPGPFDGYGRRRDVTAGRRQITRHEVGVNVNVPKKEDCPGHVAGRDELGRYPIGDCGPDCLLRAYRLDRARWNGSRWYVLNTQAGTT